MTDQKIDIADLVKPKFLPGEQVYVVRSDSHGINSISRVLVDEVRFIVSFNRNPGGPSRKTKLVYGLLNYGESSEDCLYATLDDVARSAK